MNRRHFSHLSASFAALAGGNAFADSNKEGVKAFLAKFGPHPGLLAGLPDTKEGYLGELQYAYDLGFRGWEDNGFNGQPAEVQEKVGAFMKEKKMAFGVSVISGGAGAMFNKPTDDQLAQLKKDMLRGVEVAKRSGQTFMTMLPGVRDESMSREDQIKASVDTMKMCCDLVEEHGIVLAQEPLSHGIGGGQPLIRSFEDGHLLCKLVDRKSCKLLADFYHEGAIGNGDKLVENAEKTWDQVCYIQYGDSPGRNEPGTGKLDLGAVTKFLRKKNYEGVIGLEHGVSKQGKEGLEALLAAYREIDV